MIILEMEQLLHIGKKKVKNDFVTVHTEGKLCEISLSNKLKTINLTKEINPMSKPNLSIFTSILKGVLLLTTKSLLKVRFNTNDDSLNISLFNSNIRLKK